MVPLVGASGAISGVLGLYLVWFPHNYIRVLLLLPLFITWVHIRAVWVLAMYLVIDNILPFLATHGRRKAAGASRTWRTSAGSSAGAAACAAPRPHQGPHHRAETEQPGQTGSRGRSASRGRHRAVPRAGKPHRRRSSTRSTTRKMEDAAHAFARIAREGGSPPGERHVFVLANWLYENDFIQDGAAVFRFYLKNYPRGENTDRANLGLGILLARRLGQPQAARQYLLAAIDTTPDGSQVAITARAELDRLGG